MNVCYATCFDSKKQHSLTQKGHFESIGEYRQTSALKYFATYTNTDTKSRSHYKRSIYPADRSWKTGLGDQLKPAESIKIIEPTITPKLNTKKRTIQFAFQFWFPDNSASHNLN